MSDKQPQQHVDQNEHAAERKPFVAPALRREAELTQVTAGTFTFSQTAS